MPADPVIPRNLEELKAQVGKDGQPVSQQLQGTESAKEAIGRVKYTHDAMIDILIAHPGVTQNALAQHFGYTPAWVSRVVNSDAFQARLAVRKADLVDTTLVLSIEERLKTLVSASLDKLMDKLNSGVANFDQTLKAVEIGTKALGYGARPENVQVNQNYVVAMPPQIGNQNDWSAKYNGGPEQRTLTLAERVEDVQARKV